MNQIIDKLIQEKLKMRQKYKSDGNFFQSDLIRNEIQDLGFKIIDQTDGSTKITPFNHKPKIKINQTGILAVFGSGEMSSIGRTIHEKLINSFSPPVKIALLETPAGYEVNPHH
jgi:hypothetical protein